MHKQATIPIFLFLIISLVLIFSWFRFGYIYGGGDTGLPTYNPLVMAQIAKNIWWDSLAPGIPVAQGLTSVPLLYFLSIPQVLGASPVFIQAFLFFILLFLMGYGMYLLALNIFGKANFRIATVAGVFYLFNPYMMIQIWHRFIHNSMVFAAFLPYLILTWLWWIRKRNPIYLLTFLLVNFLAVYIYGTIAFIVAIWALLFFITSLEILVDWKGRKHALKIFLTFAVGLVLWLLTNSWWLIPTFSVGPALFAQQHNVDDSLTTLVMLSRQTILPYTLRLINPFYLYWQADFGNIYQNTFFILISWLFVPVVFIGFIRGLRQKAYLIWSVLFLIVIYLAKGAAPPFSFPYIFSFSHFFPLGVIRNPFEKLGILLPAVYAILFALGLELIIIFLHKYIGKVKTYITLVIFAGLYMTFFHPMFTGKLFGNLDKPSFVSIPKAYTEANEWIKQDNTFDADGREGRILHLPLPRSEDVTYNWQYGYSGVEPSAAIFTALPSIARGLDVPKVSDALSGLSLIFYKPYANSTVILKMLQDFNIKYIIVHKDIEWRGGNLYDPAEPEEVLSKLPFIDKTRESSELTIYKIKKEYSGHKIIIADNVSLVFPEKNSSFWPWLALKEKNNIISPAGESLDESIFRTSNEAIILPRTSFLSDESTRSASLDPGNGASPISQLQKIREILGQNGEIQAAELSDKIIQANQILIKIINLFNSGQKAEIESSIKDYEKLVKEIFKNEIHTSRLLLYVNESIVSAIFRQHLSILNQIDQLAAIDLKTNLIKNDLLPVYPLNKVNQQANLRQIFKFKIPIRSQYKILMINPQSRNDYLNKLTELNFQVNQQVSLLKGENEENFISFGEVELDPGEHEISYAIPPALNLVSREQSATSLDVNLNNVMGGDIYNLSFETKMQPGEGFYLQLEQDTDSYDSAGKKVLRINQFIPQNNSSDWHSYNFSLPSLNLTSQKAVIRLLGAPTSPGLFSVPTSLYVRNLKVERLLNNTILLSSKLVNQTNSGLETFPEITRQSPGQYQGKLNLLKPSFIIFKETYHPGWKLKLKSSKGDSFTPNQHLMANLYGNAWFVERAGEYTFSLEFEPQTSVTKGIVVAGFTLVILILITFTKKFLNQPLIKYVKF